MTNPAGSALQHFVQQIRMLALRRDCVVVAVPASSPVAEGLFATARRVVVVATPTPPSILDAYVLFKAKLAHITADRTFLLVNRILPRDNAEDVWRRFDESCARFVGRGVRYLGAVPESEDAMLDNSDRFAPVFLKSLRQEMEQMSDVLMTGGLRAGFTDGYTGGAKRVFQETPAQASDNAAKAAS